MSDWWRHPQRIVQTNLRLVDAGLDPHALASELRAFGATAMLFNVGGIFAWYPSDLELQAPNPLLECDLVAEMIDAAHAADIRVIGRYDLSKATQTAYDAHPDWFCRDISGRPFEYNGTYQACVNGAWYREQSPEVLRETLVRYPLDGLFINMFGYQRNDYGYRKLGVCQCEACQRAFRDFAGMNLPQSYDPCEPGLREYLRFQGQTSTSLREEFHTLIKSLRPSIAVSNSGKRSDFFRGEINRRLDRPQEWVHMSGEQARTFRSLGGNRIRYSSAVTHFVDYPWRYASEPGPQQALRLAQQLANGADPHYYFMGLLDQPDREPIDEVRRIFQFHAENEDRYSDLDSAAKVGLYMSSKSARYGEQGSVEAFRGAYKALLESGVVFDIVHDSRAEEPEFPQEHRRYDVIVLTGASCMSQQEGRMLDAYVASGGALVAIGGTGTSDEVGQPIATCPLECLPVTGLVATHPDMRGGYVRLENGVSFPADTDLALLDGPYFEFGLKSTAMVRHRIELPQRFGPPELCYPDAECASNMPGLICGTSGEGRVAVIPWQADKLYHLHGLTPHRALIARQVSEFSSPPPVALSAEGRHEVTLQRQSSTGDLLVHVINYSGQAGDSCQSPVTLHNAKLTLKQAVNLTCKALLSGVEVRLRAGSAPGELVGDLPPIGTFEVLWLHASQK